MHDDAGILQGVAIGPLKSIQLGLQLAAKLRPVETAGAPLPTIGAGIGDGAELRQPLAITVIGGLIFSTLLTLVVIPVLYDLVDRRKVYQQPRALEGAEVGA